MAYQNSTVSFEKMLLKFIADEDPMQSMLKWLCERLMETEVENKLCAEKSERNNERQGYPQAIAFDALTQEWEPYILWFLKSEMEAIFHFLWKQKDVQRPHS